MLCQPIQSKHLRKSVKIFESDPCCQHLQLDQNVSAVRRAVHRRKMHRNVKPDFNFSAHSAHSAQSAQSALCCLPFKEPCCCVTLILLLWGSLLQSKQFAGWVSYYNCFLQRRWSWWWKLTTQLLMTHWKADIMLTMIMMMMSTSFAITARSPVVKFCNISDDDDDDEN